MICSPVRIGHLKAFVSFVEIIKWKLLGFFISSGSVQILQCPARRVNTWLPTFWEPILGRLLRVSHLVYNLELDFPIFIKL